MKLILIEDVTNLGSLGDTIEVKSGYARNYLLPKGMALLATGKDSKELRHRLQHLEKLRAGKIALANEQAEKLNALKLEILRKAGLGGKLFGSVTTQMISDELQNKGYSIDKKDIIIDDSIKSVGNHYVAIHLGENLDAKIKIKVKSEA